MSCPAPALLMVAFGGPTPGCCERFTPCPGEAHCFVSGILGHNPARRQRIAEVAAHYGELGGYSEFNAYTRKQAEALAAELGSRGLDVPTWCGYHHWRPYVRDVVAEMKTAGVREMLVLIMAPHQSSVSWDLYLRIVGEGIEQAGAGAPRVIGVVEPWWNEAGFTEAIADRISEASRREGIELCAPDTALLLTAHAVPESLSRTAPYCRQIEETAALVAAQLGGPGYRVAYQSQSGDSTVPWTQPMVEDVIAAYAEAGKSTIVSHAIGFLCDNVEVLYDLGVEGRRCAAEHGVRFVRAESVHSHPAFIRMLADRVAVKLA